MSFTIADLILEEYMDDKLKALEAVVKGKTNTREAGEALVNGVAELLDGLGQDPVAIKALAKAMHDDARAMGDAISSADARPTPAPPAPAPAPAHVPTPTTEPSPQRRSRP